MSTIKEKEIEWYRQHIVPKYKQLVDIQLEWEQMERRARERAKARRNKNADEPEELR